LGTTGGLAFAAAASVATQKAAASIAVDRGRKATVMIISPSVDFEDCDELL
jgi:hypothetical protein